MGLSNQTIKALTEKGFTTPTEIQERCIPLLLNENKDVIGQANTGTGKTAAFTLPILERVNTRSKKVQALVLAPTRELAVQEVSEMNSLKGDRNLDILAVYGGASIRDQLRELKKGVQIVVGTPGRIIDHLDRGTLDLSQVNFVVLDEADEMLNMGFIDDIAKILASCPTDKRMLFFSATMPKPIKKLAEQYMDSDYELVVVQGKEATAENIEQYYYELKQSDKNEALTRIIDISDDFYGIVFCRTKLLCDEVGKYLINNNYSAEVLHGDLSQKQRELILQKMKRKQINVLVATDVAARGIDISDLTHVINYNIPQEIESYVHRIGRTGRAGKTGIAITFINSRELSKLRAIERHNKCSITRAIAPSSKQIVSVRKDFIKSKLEDIIKEEKFDKTLPFALELSQQFDSISLIAALLKEHYEKVLDEKQYKPITNFDGKTKENRSNSSFSDYTRLKFDIGKNERVTKKGLVEFIYDATGVGNRLLERIEVLDRVSFVSAPKNSAQQIIKVFNNDKRYRCKVVIAKEKGSSSNENTSHRAKRSRQGSRTRRRRR